MRPTRLRRRDSFGGWYDLAAAFCGCCVKLRSMVVVGRWWLGSAKARPYLAKIGWLLAAR